MAHLFVVRLRPGSFQAPHDATAQAVPTARQRRVEALGEPSQCGAFLRDLDGGF